MDPAQAFEQGQPPAHPAEEVADRQTEQRYGKDQRREQKVLWTLVDEQELDRPSVDIEGDESVGAYAARQAYETAGIGPEDLSLVELHDASAPSEVIAYDYLGLCEKGQGGRLIEDGSTRLGGPHTAPRSSRARSSPEVCSARYKLPWPGGAQASVVNWASPDLS